VIKIKLERIFSQKNSAINMPKAKKDPNKPKGVKSAYIFFVEAERAENENANLNFAELSKSCGAKWAEMDDEDKAPYTKKSEKDRKRHQDEMRSYQPPASDSDSDDDGPKRKKKKKTKDPNAPKRPTTAYFFFAAARRPGLQKDDPSLSITEVASRLGQIWRGLDDDEKQPFQDQAAKDKQRYVKAIEAYNKTL
jgi:hypothetical protein